MFERFTERARQVVVLAQEEARLLRHNYIGTEHLLLGLLREEEGLAARVLVGLDLSTDDVRAQVERIVGQGDEVAAGQIPFTPRAKKVLELSLREALSLSHNYIGTEHILLGLAREGDGVAARILLQFGVDANKIRDEVSKLLGTLPPRPPGRRWRRPLNWGYRIHEPGEDLAAELARLGAEGWELVLRLDDGRLVFKRPAL
jgi:ATP-dependent Clp protease ATP-binding subunit ClpC